MKIETICCGCGRTIERDFIYCPWCGHLRVKIESKESVDSMANHFEYVRNDSRNQYIQTIEKKLETLEQELNVLVLSAEMHK